MIHEGTDHMEGIRPSVRGCPIPVLSGELCIAAGVCPMGCGGIDLRHDGRNSRMVQCMWLIYCGDCV